MTVTVTNTSSADVASVAEGAERAVAELPRAEQPVAEMELGSSGEGHLEYLVRLGKRTFPRDLADAPLERGAPNVIGARVH